MNMKLGTWANRSILHLPKRNELAGIDTESETGSGKWPAALLIAGTALLGAAAVAFWNRRTIGAMRSRLKEDSELPVTVSANEEIV